MKKLFSLVVILGFYISLSVAQTTSPAKSGSAKSKKETKAKKESASTSAAKLKKDGTPDKRYASKAEKLLQQVPAVLN